jgi:glycosyltransferase involved in cell wall biosynthesis
MPTVVASSYTPTLDSGRARRTYGLIRALAASAPVEMVYGAFGSGEVDPAFAAIEGLTLHRVERPGALERLPAYARARRAGVPGAFARGIWPGVARLAAEIAAETNAERLVSEGPVAAAGLLATAAQRPCIYSAHNLESSFRHRLGDESVSRRAMERFERLLLSRFAESWMVSPADMEGAAALFPAAQLKLVPNVVDVAAIEPVPPRQGERVVVFVADLSYEPNRQAVRFLLEQVMPLVWSRAEDVRLVLVGKGSAEVEPGDHRVEPRGFVADLRALYTEAGCALVPLLEGGGSPLKFVEALAFAVPVVATPTAAAGLEVVAGEHYAEGGPEADDFAATMIGTLDPAVGNPLAVAGRELAEREYSIEALEAKLAPR